MFKVNLTDASGGMEKINELMNNKNYIGKTSMHTVFFDEMPMPIAPEKITIKINNKNETVDLASGGAFKVLNAPGLSSYDFELIIPHDIYSMPFAEYLTGYRPPKYYFDIFERLKTDKNKDNRVFKFIVLDNSVEPTLISANCTLEDYEINQDANKDRLDYRVKIRLEKYEKHVTQSFVLVEKSSGKWEAIDENTHKSMQSAADALNAALNEMVEAVTLTAEKAAEIAKKHGGTASVASAKALAKRNNLHPCESIKAGTVIK